MAGLHKQHLTDRDQHSNSKTLLKAALSLHTEYAMTFCSEARTAVYQVG